VSQPLTLLRRTWIIPMRGTHFSWDDEGADPWGVIPPAHVEISGRAMGGQMDFEVTYNNKRVMLFEPKHPNFREWMQDFIDALQAALDAPCDVLSWAQEHFSAEETRLQMLVKSMESVAKVGMMCWWTNRTATELQNALGDIPAGAHPIWQPQLLEIVYRLPGADVDLRPWRGRPPTK